jgi:hypothetical protein
MKNAYTEKIARELIFGESGEHGKKNAKKKRKMGNDSEQKKKRNQASKKKKTQKKDKTKGKPSSSPKLTEKIKTFEILPQNSRPTLPFQPYESEIRSLMLRPPPSPSSSPSPSSYPSPSLSSPSPSPSPSPSLPRSSADSLLNLKLEKDEVAGNNFGKHSEDQSVEPSQSSMWVFRKSRKRFSAISEVA